jgi:hypothetical protein
MDHMDNSSDPNHLYDHQPTVHTHMSHGEVTGTSFHDGHGNAHYFDKEMHPTSTLMKVGNLTYHQDHMGNLLHTHLDDSAFHPKDWVGADGNMHYAPDFLQSDHINNMRSDILGRIR